MTTLRVVRPGFLTTVQDAGRPGHAHLGISASGAADALALRLGNLAVGNDPGDAALEMTLVGGLFVFEAEVSVALTGADFSATLAGKPVSPWQVIRVAAGEFLECTAVRTGVRGYLCVQGGIQVPKVLGSASTHLLTALGGHHGRALVAGDVLAIGSARESAGAVRIDPHWIHELYEPAPIRITPGPQSDRFAPLADSPRTNTTYTVLEQSNRMGIRLTGAALQRIRGEDPLTEGVSLGAIQVPGDGQPILLFVEHQTTGGYPKIANVISADLHRVGQLRPRDTVRFELVSFERAHELLLDREAQIAGLRS